MGTADVSAAAARPTKAVARAEAAEAVVVRVALWVDQTEEGMEGMERVVATAVGVPASAKVASEVASGEVAETVAQMVGAGAAKEGVAKVAAAAAVEEGMSHSPCTVVPAAQASRPRRERAQRLAMEQCGSCSRATAHLPAGQS